MALDEGIVNSLPEEIRNEPSFAEIQKGDLPGVFKQLIDSQKTLGRSIILPDEKDPEEKRVEKLNSVYEKLGRPKAHTDYKKEEVFGKDIAVTDAQAERYMKAFHEAGLSPRQANRIIKEYLADVGEQAITQEKAIATLSTGDEKHEGWGDKVEENVGICKLPLTKFDKDGEFSAYLEESGLGNNPVFLRFMHALGSSMKEDTTPGVPARAGAALDKGGAQAKIAEVMNDKAHPYWDKAKAGHKEAVEQMYEWNKIVHGTKVESVTGTH